LRHVAVDKTGTLTRNQPTVTQVLTTGNAAQDEVLSWAAALKTHSTHPLAAAITAASAVTESAGAGIAGLIDGAHIAVGSPRWLDPGPLADHVHAMEARGITVVVVHRDDHPV
ncbi:HAD family hydrolase, partial [Dietzia maris]